MKKLREISELNLRGHQELGVAAGYDSILYTPEDRERVLNAVLDIVASERNAIFSSYLHASDTTWERNIQLCKTLIESMAPHCGKVPGRFAACTWFLIDEVVNGCRLGPEIDLMALKSSSSVGSKLASLSCGLIDAFGFRSYKLFDNRTLDSKYYDLADAILSVAEMAEILRDEPSLGDFRAMVDVGGFRAIRGRTAPHRMIKTAAEGLRPSLVICCDYLGRTGRMATCNELMLRYESCLSGW